MWVCNSQEIFAVKTDLFTVRLRGSRGFYLGFFSSILLVIISND